VTVDKLIVRSPEFSMLMEISAHDVWFRLLKDELSLKREYGSAVQGCNIGNRRLFGVNQTRELGLLLACPRKAGGRSIYWEMIETLLCGKAVCSIEESSDGYERYRASVG
jgi:hypothetical protein